MWLFVLRPSKLSLAGDTVYDRDKVIADKKTVLAFLLVQVFGTDKLFNDLDTHIVCLRLTVISAFCLKGNTGQE